MPGSYSDGIDVGSFVPTTQIYDIGLVRTLDVNSDMFSDFLVTLTQSINNICWVINTKRSGYYVTTEFVNGDIYYPNPALNSSTPQLPTFRQCFNIVVICGPLPNTGIKTVAHNIPNIDVNFSFKQIYGTANDHIAFMYRPIPYVNVAGQIISLDVDANNVIIETNFDGTAYTDVEVVLKYIKQ